MARKHNYDEDVLFNQIADLCFEWIEQNSGNSRGRYSRLRDLEQQLFRGAIHKRLENKYPFVETD